MRDYSPFSDVYLLVLAAAALAVTVLAIVGRSGSLGLAAAVLVIYLLHLGSLRSVERGHRRRRGTLRQVERMVEDVRGLDASRAESARATAGVGASAGAAAADPGEEGSGGGAHEEATGDEPRVHRQFAFGTVALIEDLLTPEEVSHVLLEQERQPNRRFGEIALRYGFLTEDQVKRLLEVQREGLFSPDAIRSARQRVEAYRKNQVADLSKRLGL